MAQPDAQAPRGAISRDNVNYNTVAAALSIVLAVVLFLIIPSQIDKPLIKLGASQANLPPELFPQLVAGAFFLLGIWYFFASFKLRQRNQLRDLDKEAIVNVAGTLVIMAAYVWLMVNLGFVVGSAIMIFAMSTFFGNRNYLLGAAVGIAVPMIVFVIFGRLLKTELPPFPIDIYPLTNWSLL